MEVRDLEMTSEEAAEVAAEADRADHDLAEPLRALGPTGELDLDFTDRVMARVRQQPRGWWQSMWARVRRPVSARSGLLASVPVVVGVVAVTFLLFKQSSLLASQPERSPVYAGSDLFPVEFQLSAPDASRVTLAGDFNHWRTDTIALADPDRDGVWTVTLSLAPGSYTYLFVVDGNQRVVDPHAEVDRSGAGQRSILHL